MKVRIRMIGRTREDWARQAEAEYHKRLRPWMRLDGEELRAEELRPGRNAEDCRQLEGQRLLSGLDPRAVCVALDASGTLEDSPSFAALLGGWLESGAPELAFLIGGTEGLAPPVLQRADTVLSLSRMTFTHQMVRLFLVEQLYRACMIRAGRPYHR